MEGPWTVWASTARLLECAYIESPPRGGAADTSGLAIRGRTVRRCIYGALQTQPHRHSRFRSELRAGRGLGPRTRARRHLGRAPAAARQRVRAAQLAVLRRGAGEQRPHHRQQRAGEHQAADPGDRGEDRRGGAAARRLPERAVRSREHAVQVRRQREHRLGAAELRQLYEPHLQPPLRRQGGGAQAGCHRIHARAHDLARAEPGRPRGAEGRAGEARRRPAGEGRRGRGRGIRCAGLLRPALR